MDKTFFSLYKFQFRSFNVKCVFMYANASKLTWEFFEHERFTGEKIMEWPLSSPDLKLIENIWSFVEL